MRHCFLENQNSALICSLVSNNLFILKDKTPFKFIMKNNINFSLKIFGSDNYSIILSNYSVYKNRLYNLLSLFDVFYTTIKINKKEHILFKGFFILVDLIGLGFRIAKITDRIFFFELG